MALEDNKTSQKTNEKHRWWEIKLFSRSSEEGKAFREKKRTRGWGHGAKIKKRELELGFSPSQKIREKISEFPRQLRLFIFLRLFHQKIIG